MKTTTHKIVFTAVFTALVCVATMIIKIPSPLKGYLNVGDCMVLFAAWTLSPVYGMCAAGLGSALADVFSGYLIYAPATFVIKGAMALVAYGVDRLMKTKWKGIASHVVSGTLAEVVMILGYFLFEGVMYGFIPSLANIPANAVQGVAGIVLGVILIKIFEKTKIAISDKKEK